MKFFLYSLIVGIFVLLVPVNMFAQITVTVTDILNATINKERTTEGHNSDTLTVNLGTASNSAQTFDYSNLHPQNVAVITTLKFYSPAGQWHASEFPNANVSPVYSVNYSFPPYTMMLTLTQYNLADNSGAYDLGLALRQQWTPSAPPGYPVDTTTVVHNNALGFPLPQTLGTQRTWTDTVYDFEGDFKIETHVYAVNGFGNVTYPDGRTLPSLRIVDDKVSLEYHGGVFTGRDHTRDVVFGAQDFTQLTFDVDSNYSGGTTRIDGYRYESTTGTVGVEQVSNTIPEEFILNQNYPNPFNPSTVISFAIPQAGHVSLKVYDLLGREVAELVDRQMQPGTYQIQFDASALSSGLYYYRIVSGNLSKTLKMMIVK